MAWVAICERNRAGMGRGRDKTYRNVLTSVRKIDQASAADFVIASPSHPWSQPGNGEFIVDLTPDARPLFHDGIGTLPRWQQETATSGATPSFGSFADPEDDQSAFTESTPLEDDRWIVRLYDADPGTTGQHIAAADFDEGTGNQTVYLKLFNSDDTPSATNAQNAKTEIAGKLMIFDFTAGVTTLDVKTDAVGRVTFPSDYQYRVVGPGGEKEARFRIYGRTLSVRE